MHPDFHRLAVEEIGEARSFVKDLIRAQVPDNERLVFLRRSCRQNLLTPPPEAVRIELLPFKTAFVAERQAKRHPSCLID
ncbi:hypothetical protein RHPLAN_63470 [Rhodoplanes sp. Z2-YC6860]|nr:hypothetical protein RHPLAN_63470 [Rhodoplanes sp. Z2-YC6860]